MKPNQIASYRYCRQRRIVRILEANQIASYDDLYAVPALQPNKKKTATHNHCE